MNDCGYVQASSPASLQAMGSDIANPGPDERPLTKLLDNVLYGRLRSLASGILRREPPDPCWEAADLVHEAFLRMARSRSSIRFQSTTQLFALTAIVMRHILIDHARSAKICAPWRKVTLDRDLPSDAVSRWEELALREALERLGKLQFRLYQIVEMRFFSGLAVEEIASQLSISTRTVNRAWKAAQDWLRHELADSGLSSKRQDRRHRTAVISPATPEAARRQRRRGSAYAPSMVM